MSGAFTAISLGASATVGAIVGVGVLGAGATIYGANKAAGATQDASNAAVKEQQAALAQQKELGAPYTALGQTAITPLEQLLGLTPGSIPGSQQAALANTPGYQFALQQGLQSTQAKANALGMGLSGNTLAALDQYSTGLADQTYQERVTNLQDVVGIGQAAAAGQAANIGQSAANIGNIQMAQGQTQAGLAVNEAAALSKIGGSAVNQYLTMNTLKGLQGGSYQAPAYPTATYPTYPGGSPGDPGSGFI
jgi:hypothetical protein